MSRAQLGPPPAHCHRGWVVVLLAGLLLAGCARSATGSGDADAGAPDAGASSTGPTTASPADPDAVLLQVARVGGFTSAEELRGRLPDATVYADGRVVTQGPEAAVFPPPAWPGLQVTRLDPARLPGLVDRALAAGVGERGDLGPPGVVDAPSTRFTVLTTGGPVVREVDALQEGLASGMLTGQQRADRERLAALAGELVGLAGAADTWTPGAVALLAHPYVPGVLGADGELLDTPAVAWPGPALPGAPLDGALGCVVVPAEQLPAVRQAARAASTTTPWTTPDGVRWSLTFRPLLPHERGCADLAG